VPGSGVGDVVAGPPEKPDEFLPHAFLIDGQKEEEMPFIASNGLTEAGTAKTIAAGGMMVHYHDLGEGEPVLFLHSYGPGTTAWITFHKAVGGLSQHFRCILMDLPNFSKTGPIVYREGVHAVQARTAVALLDALGIARACWVGNSQGGQSAMVAAITYPERVSKFVMGGSHIGTGGDRYLMAPRRGAAPPSAPSPTRALTTSAITCVCTSTTKAW
jgi:pimeloyl-ACP methyl ester carboxylesterase